MFFLEYSICFYWLVRPLRISGPKLNFITSALRSRTFQNRREEKESQIKVCHSGDLFSETDFCDLDEPDKPHLSEWRRSNLELCELKTGLCVVAPKYQPYKIIKGHARWMLCLRSAMMRVNPVLASAGLSGNSYFSLRKFPEEYVIIHILLFWASTYMSYCSYWAFAMHKYPVLIMAVWLYWGRPPDLPT